MKIRVNGEEMDVAEDVSVSRLLDEIEAVGENRRGVAVARNGAVVPRSRWDDTALEEGDAIEIVTAKQGG